MEEGIRSMSFKPDQTVLINGTTGASGSLAAQIAKGLGPRTSLSQDAMSRNRKHLKPIRRLHLT